MKGISCGSLAALVLCAGLGCSSGPPAGDTSGAGIAESHERDEAQDEDVKPGEVLQTDRERQARKDNRRIAEEWREGAEERLREPQEDEEPGEEVDEPVPETPEP